MIPLNLLIVLFILRIIAKVYKWHHFITLVQPLTALIYSFTLPWPTHSHCPGPLFLNALLHPITTLIHFPTPTTYGADAMHPLAWLTPTLP